MEEYRIRMQGLLDPRRNVYFDKMTMTSLPNGDTELTGVIQDQAALYAIISRIRDLGLTLLLVEKATPSFVDRTEHFKDKG